MVATKADVAAADLHARIVQLAQDGPLAGVEAEVRTASGKRLHLVITRLPPGFAVHGPGGLEPTPSGARVTDLLHHLAKLACDHARLTERTLLLVRPDVLAASAGPSTRPERRAS